jgi:FtsP/CotA-like multicopper oxidase with cupredoxin domain
MRRSANWRSLRERGHPGRRVRLRLVVACVATAAVAGPLLWYWQASRLPSTYAVTDHGYADAGGATHNQAAHAHAGHSGRSVDALTADPARPPDVALTLTARQERFALASGRKVRGYTLNGQSPGPVIRATAGQLVQVTLINESVPDGVALHWHGVDVPNAADGVAGVTQDAVGPGRTHTYRFVVDPGTYWYHSHQVSHAQVVGGMLGALIVSPDPADTLALVHVYDGIRTVNGQEGDVRVPAAPGQRVRVRIVNTDNGRMSAWVSGAPFTLVAIDGTDVHGPTEVRDVAVPVTAGARADLSISMPSGGGGVRVHLGGSAALLLGAGAPAVPKPAAELDPLGYGTPAPLAFDPERADRRFEYDIGRRPGFLDGKPGLWWSINGHLYPDVPMFTVAEGDVVRMRIANHSGEAHPMHLHGHHALVLSRDGRSATGSPWWVDSLDVGNGESYDIAFVADNPGIWMDHCHNLPHAGEGLTAHLMYEGVTTPYTVGGRAGNEPE